MVELGTQVELQRLFRGVRKLAAKSGDPKGQRAVARATCATISDVPETPRGDALR